MKGTGMNKSFIAITFAVLGVLTFASGCTDEEIAIFKTLRPEEQAAVVAHRTTPEPEPQHTPPGGFLACVRRHESGGNYRAENPSSTASGAYQYLDSSWRTLSARAGHGGYGHASHAPPWVQDAVAIYTVNSGWSSAWNGTGC